MSASSMDWERMLLALATPTTAPRKIKLGLEKNPRGPFVCCYCCCTPRDRILSTQTFFGTHLHLILSTQTFSSNSSSPDSYYKLFLATPLHLILTTQTLSSNPSATNSCTTAQMQSSKEFVLPLQSRTPGKAYPAARLYILSLIHIWRCRRIERCRSRWSPYH